MNKFTSGPWEAKFYRNGPVWGWDIKAGGKVIARIAGGAIWEDKPNSQDEADARRIVQCVNSFDDLLKACQLVTETAGDSGYLDRFLDENVGKLGVYLTPDELRMIQAAIARATGGNHE